jgi:nucleoside-triphosphatase THEP1
MNDRSPLIWIITGARETGKTRFCTHLVEKARKEGMDIAGLLSPPVYMNGVKTAIEVEDIRSNERRTLARGRQDDPTSIQTKRWSFDEEVLNWGNDLLAEATPCDVLVVDELGLLEFERGGGWQNGITAIQSEKFQLAVVVIRPELIDEALLAFNNTRVMDIPPQLEASQEQDMLDLILGDFNSPDSLR